MPKKGSGSANGRQSYSVIATNYSGGADYTSSPENLKPEQLTQAINCRYSKQGGVFVRGGFLSTANLATGYPVTDIEPMPQYGAMFCKSGTKVYQTSDGTTWYDVGITATASERSNFFALFKDMYFMNNGDPFIRIAVSRLTADADLVHNKLTVITSDATQFGNTGTVYIRGIPVTYNPPVTYTAYSPPTYTTNYGSSAYNFDSPSHGMANNTAITLWFTGASSCPVGFTAANTNQDSPGPTYYVVNAATNTFQLSATPSGPAIGFSSDAVGTNTYRITSVTQWTFTSASHGLNAEDEIYLTNATGNAPTGLTLTTDLAVPTKYFVINPTTNTFQVSTDGVNPVQFTSNGTGTNQYTFVLAGNVIPTCTGLTSAMKNGDLITQVYQQLDDGAATSFTTAPYKPSCMATIEQITLIAGDPGAPHVIYQSVPYTIADPALAYDFVDTSSGAASMEIPNTVTCLKGGNNLVLIGTKMGIHYSTGTDPTTAQLVTHPVSYDHGVPNQRCITTIDENMYVVFTGRRFLVITKDVYGVRIADDPQNPMTNFDYPIRKYLLANADQDQTESWTHFDPVTREFSGAVMINGIKQIFVNNIDLRAWSIDQDKNFACAANFNYRVWAGSDDKNLIYLDNEGHKDDTFITHAIWTSPIYTVDQKRITADYENVAFAGLLSPAGSFIFRVFVSGSQGQAVFEYPFSAAQLQAQGLMTIPTGNPLGGTPLSAQTVGTGGNLSDTYYFNCPIQLLASGEKFQMQWEVVDEGTSLEIRDSKMDAEHSATLYATPF